MDALANDDVSSDEEIVEFWTTECGISKDAADAAITYRPKLLLNSLLDLFSLFEIETTSTRGAPKPFRGVLFTQLRYQSQEKKLKSIQEMAVAAGFGNYAHEAKSLFSALEVLIREDGRERLAKNYQDEVLRDALEAHQALREWIEAVPEEVVNALPAMPGTDGDWLNEVKAGLEKALAHLQQAPLLPNGLTETETNSTASVMGLVRSVQRKPLTDERIEAVWVPVTEALLNEQHPWLYKTMWIAMKDGRVLKGRYEWRQGRNPDRLYSDGPGDEWAYDASYVMPLQAPAHPNTTQTAAPTPLTDAQELSEGLAAQRSKGYQPMPDYSPEIFPGATKLEIGSVAMQSLVGDYENPAQVPEWTWVQREAVQKVIDNAPKENMAYLVIHQGT